MNKLSQKEKRNARLSTLTHRMGLLLCLSGLLWLLPGADTFGKSNQLQSFGPGTTLLVPLDDEKPVARDTAFTMQEDSGPIEITLPASDPEGEALKYAIKDQPSYGSLSAVVANKVSYTPAANYHGADDFTFVARNTDDKESNKAKVSLTIQAVNDAPVASAGPDQTVEDADGNGSEQVQLDGSASSDADDSIESYTWTWPGGSGADGQKPTATLPVGATTITLTVTDQAGATATDQVTITVNAKANQAPVAKNVNVTIDEDQQTEIKLEGEDEGTLTYEIVKNPDHGTLGSISSDGKVTYTPANNYNGSDSFTYQASDGTATSNTATVAITINPVNDPPEITAQAKTLATNENQALTIPLDALTVTDVDNTYPNGFSLKIQAGTNYTVSGNDITPKTGFSGDLKVAVKVDDGKDDSNVFELTVAVKAKPNQPPVAQDISVETDEDKAVKITLKGSDADGNALSFNIVTTPKNGTLSSISNGEVTYTPKENYNGSDSFTYLTNDGTVNSNTATVSLTVNPVNDAPVANAGPDQTVEDADGNGSEQVQLDGSASSDTDDGIESYTWTWSGGGPATGARPNVTLPAGATTITLTVKDKTGATATDQVVITVKAKTNNPPVAQDVSAETDEDRAIKITLKGSDPDGNAIQYSTVSNPTNGTLSAVSNGEVTYTPKENYNGPDSFTYRVSDGTATSTTATVTLTVKPINDAPVANAGPDQTVQDTDRSGNEAVKLDGSASSDTDDGIESYTWTWPGGGPATGARPNITLPVGITIITLTVKDKAGDRATDQVTITVSLKPNQPPVAQDISVETDEGKAVKITLKGSDADGDALTFTKLTDPTNGTLSSMSNAEVTYMPEENVSGSDSFTYRVSDGKTNSNTATVSINIKSVNDIPVLSNLETQPITFNEGDMAQNLTQTLIITDIDDTQLESAVVQFIKTGDAGFYPGEDMLDYVTPPGISANWNPATGVLTFIGVVSLENYQTALRSVKYSNTKTTNLTSGLREVALTVNDGENNSESVSRFVAVSNPDLPPMLTNINIITLEDKSYTFLQADFAGSYSDPEAQPFTGIYIRSLPANGTLSLAGKPLTQQDIDNAPPVNDRFAGLQVAAAAIPTLSYMPAQHFFGKDSFAWSASDGSSFAANPASVLITIEAVNNPPVIGAPPSVNVPAKAPFLFTRLSVADPDAGTSALRVTLSVGQGLLSFANQDVVRLLSFKEGDGTQDATITFEANQDNINTALASLSYVSNDMQGRDTLLIRVSDLGASGSGGQQQVEKAVMININATNTAPVLAGVETIALLYTAGSGAVSITQTLTVVDAENDSITKATVIFTKNFQVGEDRLSFKDTDKIKGSFSNGTLTLNGIGSTEAYQNALRSVMYENTSDNPNTAVREVTFRVTDMQESESQPVGRAIDIQLPFTDLVVNAGENVTICAGESAALQVSVSGGSGNYAISWTCNQPACALDNNNTASVSVSPSSTTTYIVEVTDETSQTVASDTVTVSLCTNASLSIPTGITPNGDDINDTWVIRNIGRDANIQVFDRYGKRVFYSEGYAQPWNGTFGGNTLPVGTYYYVISQKDGGETRKGSVTILR